MWRAEGCRRPGGSNALATGRGGSRCRRFAGRGLVGGGCLDVLEVGLLTGLVGLLLCLGGGGGELAFFFFSSLFFL